MPPTLESHVDRPTASRFERLFADYRRDHRNPVNHFLHVGVGWPIAAIAVILLPFRPLWGLGLFAMAYAIFADLRDPARSHLTGNCMPAVLAHQMFGAGIGPMWSAQPESAEFDRELVYVPKPGTSRLRISLTLNVGRADIAALGETLRRVAA